MAVLTDAWELRLWQFSREQRHDDQFLEYLRTLQSLPM